MNRMSVPSMMGNLTVAVLTGAQGTVAEVSEVLDLCSSWALAKPLRKTARHIASESASIKLRREVMVNVDALLCDRRI